MIYYYDQVMMLLAQAKDMPKITSAGITDIGMSILGTAVTSIATYLLVLLQFHLTFENHDS